MASARGYVPLIVLSVIWGLAFVAIRRADFELSWENLTLLRWMLVSACFLALYPFIGKSKVPLERRDIPRLLVVSLANVAVYHLSLNFAEKTVSASLSGLLISLGPVFTVILSTILLKEKVGRRLGFAVVLALVGAVLISLPDMDLGFATMIGPLAVVIAAFANGVYAVVSKPLVTKYGASPVAIWASLVGTASILPLASGSLIQEASALSFGGWVSVLYLVVLSTVVGNLIIYTLIGRQPVSRLGVQLYLIPLVSVIGGILILGETIGVLTVLGGAFLLMAVGMTTTIRR
ncbi:MAG: DMT family transporter [Nitrososphaerales archaeon]|nr:DMT family transporter [Nitrososphaerales archaeon]